MQSSSTIKIIIFLGEIAMLEKFIGIVSDDPRVALQFNFAFDLHMLNELGISTEAFPHHTRHDPIVSVAISNFFRFDPVTQVHPMEFKDDWFRVYLLLVTELVYTCEYMAHAKKMNLTMMHEYEVLMRTAHDNANKLMLSYR